MLKFPNLIYLEKIIVKMYMVRILYKENYLQIWMTRRLLKSLSVFLMKLNKIIIILKNLNSSKINIRYKYLILIQVYRIIIVRITWMTIIIIVL